MNNSELSTASMMDEDLIEGMGAPVSKNRLNSIEVAANNASQLESERLKTGVSEAVKSLEKETGEMFPNKEEVAETTVESETPSKEEAAKTSKAKEERLIFVMKPLNFGITLVGAGVVAYLIYRSVKK